MTFEEILVNIFNGKSIKMNDFYNMGALAKTSYLSNPLASRKYIADILGCDGVSFINIRSASDGRVFVDYRANCESFAQFCKWYIDKAYK